MKNIKKTKRKILEVLGELHTCADCGRKTGENHGECCDIERCPKCKGQFISCGCEFPNTSADGKYLIDNENKKWERHLVKTSIDEDFGMGN